MKYGRSFLINFFEAFYLIILRNKLKIEKSIFFNINDNDEIKQIKVSDLQNELYVFVKDKHSKIIYEGGKIAGSVFEEISYIMVALADEIFLSMDWEGKAFWRKNLLEHKIFGTTQAGEKIFANIETFIKEQNTQNNEIGIIYLYTLSLGFKGKLRNEANCDFYIKSLKERLFNSIYKHSSELYSKEEALFLQAYENVFIEKAKQYEHPFRIWGKIFVLCLLVYLCVSEIVWTVHMRNTWAIIRTAKESGII